MKEERDQEDGKIKWAKIEEYSTNLPNIPENVSRDYSKMLLETPEGWTYYWVQNIAVTPVGDIYNTIDVASFLIPWQSS